MLIIRRMAFACISLRDIGAITSLYIKNALSICDLLFIFHYNQVVDVDVVFFLFRRFLIRHRCLRNLSS